MGDYVIFAIVGAVFVCLCAGLVLARAAAQKKQNTRVEEPAAPQGETANPIGTSPTTLTIQGTSTSQVDPRDI